MTQILARTSHLSSALRLTVIACAAFLFGLAGLASSAAAQADSRDDLHTVQGARPEFHMSLGGHGDFGAGFRVDLPIVPSGFLRNGRDEFALSPGLDVQFLQFHHDDDDDDHAVLLLPQLAAQWNFYFPRGWSIFPELGAAVVIGDAHHGYGGDGDVHVDPLVAFGARRHFSERSALVMRAGFPSGFQLGIAI
jgi:hypothetical protein